MVSESETDKKLTLRTWILSFWDLDLGIDLHGSRSREQFSQTYPDPFPIRLAREALVIKCLLEKPILCRSAFGGPCAIFGEPIDKSKGKSADVAKLGHFPTTHLYVRDS